MSPSESFGSSHEMQFGLIVKDITNASTVNELSSLYKNKNFQIQLIDPTPEIISSEQFTRLSNEGFVWYLSFSDYGKMEAALQSYYQAYNNEVIVELRNNGSFNKDTTINLLSRYPKARFHASHFVFWPREAVRELAQQLPPSQLDAISIYTIVDSSRANVFDDIFAMFATFYDAAKDINGNSDTKVNLPDGSKLSLADIQTLDSSVKEQARRYGIISSAFVVYIQTKDRNNDATMKYVTAGTFEDLAADEKKIISFYSNYINLGYDMLWPWANTANGDPWYNPFLDRSNTDPIMGIIGIKNGKYMGIVFNSRDMTSTAKLPSSIDFAGYKSFSTIRGNGDYIGGGNEITFQPYETIVFYTDDVVAPVITPTQPQPTGQQTPTDNPNPTPTGETTGTPNPTGTVAPPTNIPTVIPTNTPISTKAPTPVPTDTPIPTMTPTLAPTYTPVPPPTSTPTPVKNLTVNNQPPGITPWSLLLIPLGILILGLLL